MVTAALLWWLGQQVQAPVWYFGVVAVVFLVKLFGFICKVLEKLLE